MNGEGGIGQAEEDLGYLRGDYVTRVDFGSFDPIGFYPGISMGFLPTLPAAFFELPPILLPTSTTSEGGGDSATPEPGSLSPVVVDPEQGKTSTVFEDAPGGVYETSRKPTDWNRVYDEYVVLNQPEVDVGIFDSVDWGEVVGGVVGGIFDPVGLGRISQDMFTTAAPDYSQLTMPVQPQVQPGVSPVTQCTCGGGKCPGGGPRYAKICLATREITPLRRRRRRRLLTSSDIKDLSALKSIVGGAALQAAVTQAVRR